MESLFSKQEILNYLPHREPFLFVDYIEGFLDAADRPMGLNPKDPNFSPFQISEVVGHSVIGHYRICGQHPIFQGHFPHYPILPGVIHVELMAQVASFFPLLIEPKLLTSGTINVKLLGIDRARFKKPLHPEDNVTVRTKLLKARQGFLTFAAQLHQDQVLISEAEFLAWIALPGK